MHVKTLQAWSIWQVSKHTKGTAEWLFHITGPAEEQSQYIVTEHRIKEFLTNCNFKFQMLD